MDGSVFLISFSLLLAGIAIAGGLWILLKQQVVVREDGSPTSVQLPFFGKIQTNYPSLVSVFLGAAISYLCIGKIPDPEPAKINLNASISLDQGVSRHVFVHAIPKGNTGFLTPNPGLEAGSVDFVLDANHDYTVVAYTIEVKEGDIHHEIISQPDGNKVAATDQLIYEIDFTNKLAPVDDPTRIAGPVEQ